MRLSLPRVTIACGLLVLGFAGLSAELTHAVVAPSFWTTDINVQEDPNLVDPFADWDTSGISVVVTDPADNPGLWDIHQIQIANDNEFLYLRVTYHNNLSVGTLIGFDLDQDPNTGWDPLQQGLLGAELGYLNDFAFEHDPNGVLFNTDDPLLGGPLGNGGALIAPIWNVNGPQKEYAIPLDSMFTNDVTDPNGPPVQIPVFENDTFDLMVYHDLGLGDVTEVITYTLATAPTVDGDFNGDGFVDGLDHLEWQLGNSPNNGSSGDLLLWETNYGMAPPVGAVPEPTSLMLVLSTSVSLLSRRRRRQSAA